VDSLPTHAQKSKVLTGNDLGRLGNTAHKPSEEAIKNTRELIAVKAVLTISNTEEKYKELHLLAKKYLEEQKLVEALSVLFCAR